MRLPVLLNALLSALLLAPQSGFAQAPPEPERAPGWVFTPSLGVGGAWDDNLLLLHRGDNPPRDYGSPIQPAFALDYTGRRTRFSTGYDGTLVLYRTLHELNSSQHTLRGSLEHRPTARLTLFGQGNFDSAPTTDALEFAGIPFYRVGSRTGSAGGGFAALMGKQTSLRAAYTLQSVSFEFDERLGHELRGGHGHQIEVALERRLSPRLTLGGDYSLQRAIIVGQPAVEDFGQDDQFNIHMGMLTAAYQVGRTLSVSGGGGLARLVAGQAHPARTGPTLRAGVTHRGRHAELSGAYHRSFIPSFGFGGTFQNEEWSGSVRVPFARNRAYAAGSVSWMTSEPLEVGVPDLRSLWLSGVFGYRATPWLRLEGFYRRAQQGAERADGLRARNQIGFQVVTAKPLRLR